MATARLSPLPDDGGGGGGGGGGNGYTLQPGFYWINSFEKPRPTTGELYWPFNEYRKTLPRGYLQIRKVTPHFDSEPRREWLLFEVVQPITWTEAAAYGAGKPSPATRTTEPGDTVQRPEPQDAKDPLDWLQDFVGGLGIAGGCFLLWVLSDLLKKGR